MKHLSTYLRSAAFQLAGTVGIGLIAISLVVTPSLAQTSMPRPQSLAGNPYLLQGTRYDAETGLYYFRNRYYDPRAGRFLQRDPAWDPINVGSAYTFAGNSPASRVDPSGQLGPALIPFLVVMAIAATASVIVYGEEGHLEDSAEVATGWVEGMGETIGRMLESLDCLNPMPRGKLSPSGEYTVESPAEQLKRIVEMAESLKKFATAPGETLHAEYQKRVDALAAAIERGDLRAAGKILGGSATEAGIAAESLLASPKVLAALKKQAKCAKNPPPAAQAPVEPAPGPPPPQQWRPQYRTQNVPPNDPRMRPEPVGPGGIDVSDIPDLWKPKPPPPPPPPPNPPIGPPIDVSDLFP